MNFNGDGLPVIFNFILGCFEIRKWRASAKEQEASAAT
jgi:hypothetical protein